MLCEKGECVVGLLFWYLIIGLVIGAYGKATAGVSSGALFAEVLTLVFFTLCWPFIIIWSASSKWKKS